MEDELRFPHALAWDADYWLCRCEGFRVDAPGGRVGVVEGVRFLTRLDRPDALLVRTRPFGQRLLSVPVAEIEHVLPLEQRIVLHQPPVPARTAPRIKLRSLSSFRGKPYNSDR